MTQVHSYLKATKMRVGLLLILVKRVGVFVKRGKEPRDFTRNLFLERKAYQTTFLWERNLD